MRSRIECKIEGRLIRIVVQNTEVFDHAYGMWTHTSGTIELNVSQHKERKLVVVGRFQARLKEVSVEAEIIPFGDAKYERHVTRIDYPPNWQKFDPNAWMDWVANQIASLYHEVYFKRGQHDTVE